MFIRVMTTTNSPKKSFQIVESVPVGNKVSQKVVGHVGTVFADEPLKMMELPQYIKSELDDPTIELKKICRSLEINHYYIQFPMD